MTLITLEFYEAGHDTEALLYSNKFSAMYDCLESRTYIFPESNRDAVIRPIEGIINLEAL